MSGLKAVMDLEQQFVTAFESLRSVLAGAGAELGDVVELVSYQVEIRRHMSAFVKVKDRYIGEPYVSKPPAAVPLPECQEVARSSALQFVSRYKSS